MTDNTLLRDAFFAAIRRGDLADIQQAVAQQPELVNARTAEGVSATLYSLYYREPAIATYLASAEAEISVFEAAALGQAEALRALLVANPTLVNAFSPDGFTPLGLAAFFGQLETTNALLDAGADSNLASRNAMRVAPLHSAVAAQQLAIVEALLKHDANVNAVQTDDFTPLLEAAQNGQVEMIELLLHYGAHLDARKTDGQTALAVALAHGEAEAAATLRAYGATE